MNSKLLIVLSILLFTSNGDCFGETIFNRQSIFTSIDTVYLWHDEKPKFSNGISTPEEQREGGRIRNVSDPYMIIYRPKDIKKHAIIMCPGGSYISLSMQSEGKDFAEWFAKQGVVYAILKYRMPSKGHWQVPLEDANQSMRILNKKPLSWGKDSLKVGIGGFSAGGHLASTFANNYDADTRPDFQILIYPVISMSEELTHKDSRRNLLGDSPTEELINNLSNELRVTSNTPPALLIHSADDRSVSPLNSINYFLALRKNGVKASLHIYPNGGHGWGSRNTNFKIAWQAEVETWLNYIK